MAENKAQVELTVKLSEESLRQMGAQVNSALSGSGGGAPTGGGGGGVGGGGRGPTLGPNLPTTSDFRLAAANQRVLQPSPLFGQAAYFETLRAGGMYLNSIAPGTGNSLMTSALNAEAAFMNRAYQQRQSVVNRVNASWQAAEFAQYRQDEKADEALVRTGRRSWREGLATQQGWREAYVEGRDTWRRGLEAQAAAQVDEGRSLWRAGLATQQQMREDVVEGRTAWRRGLEAQSERAVSEGRSAWRRGLATRDRELVANFQADIAGHGPSRQVRELDSFMAANPYMDSGTLANLRRQRNMTQRNTPMAQFLGQPSGMGLYFQAMFGGFEAGRATLAYGESLYKTQGIASADSVTTQMQYIDRMSSGILGSSANLLIDPMGRKRAGIDSMLASAEGQDRLLARARGDRASMSAIGNQTVSMRSTGFSRDIAIAAAGKSEAAFALDETIKKREKEDQGIVDANRARLNEKYDDRIATARSMEQMALTHNDRTGAAKYARQATALETAKSQEDFSFSSGLTDKRDKYKTQMTEAQDAMFNAVVENVKREITKFSRGNAASATSSALIVGGNSFAAAANNLSAKQREESIDMMRSTEAMPLIQRAIVRAGFNAKQVGEQNEFNFQQGLPVNAINIYGRAATLRASGQLGAATQADIDSQFNVNTQGGQRFFGDIGPSDPRYAGMMEQYTAASTMGARGVAQEGAAASLSFITGIRMQAGGRMSFANQMRTLQDEYDVLQKGLTYGSQEWQNVENRRQGAVAALNQQIIGANMNLSAGNAFSGGALNAAFGRNTVGAAAYGLAGSLYGEGYSLLQRGFTQDHVAFREWQLNAQAQFGLIDKQYRDSFRGQQINLRMIDTTNPKDSQNPVEVLKSIESALREFMSQMDRAIAN